LLYFVLVKSDASLGFAASQLLGGLTFSLGLIPVIVAGTELVTGNNLLAMAWADGKISTFELLRNWTIVCGANSGDAAGLSRHLPVGAAPKYKRLSGRMH
jgi:formate/nitrite transporter FocA (FNT family)